MRAMAELLHLSPEEATAVHLSVRVALWAMTTSLIPGVLVAVVLARGRFWGKALLDGVVHLPLVMPPAVTGYLLLLLLGRRGPLDQFLDEIRLSVDRRLEGAAATLGAGPVWVFLVITLPLTLPGTILSFARSMGEFGATITFVSNIPGETQTLPWAIYTLTQIPGGDAGALRLTAISIAISMLALLAAEFLARWLACILPAI
jgi:molybdate transport system permease protein